MHRHLSACVERKLRRDFTDELRNAEILDEHGVSAGGSDLLDRLNERGLLVLAHEGIERDVDAGISLMSIADGTGEGIAVEVIGTLAGVKAARAEVDCVRTALDSGDQRIASARGSEQFGFIHG